METVPIAVRTFTTAIAVCGLLAACKPPASQPDAAEADAPAIDAPVHRGIDLGVTWTPIGYVQATQGDLTAFYQGHAACGTTIAVHRPGRGMPRDRRAVRRVPLIERGQITLCRLHVTDR